MAGPSSSPSKMKQATTPTGDKIVFSASAASASSSVKSFSSSNGADVVLLSNVWIQRMLHVAVHLFCIGIYLYPVLHAAYHNAYSGPTLDEMHIMSVDNKDIQGGESDDEDKSFGDILYQIFSNDYWGRPMQSPSSHKSWRPLTVLSFRYLKGLYTSFTLQSHRFVNILAHACTADLVGILAVQLYPKYTTGSTTKNSNSNSYYYFLLHIVTKVVFVLHPTHVEVTANCANRNHIFAVLCSVVLCDPNISMVLLQLILLVGFLCSETFLFQLPAVIVTMIVIRTIQRLYNNDTNEDTEEDNNDDDDPNDDDGKNNNNKKESSTTTSTTTTEQQQQFVVMPLLVSTITLLPRIFLIVLSIVVYLFGRYYYNTLDIPEGLIRPAENPFYHFKGTQRVRNYVWVVTIHILKSLGLDPIGFSHEYGYNCISPIETWNIFDGSDDSRLLVVLGVFGILLGSTILILVLVVMKSRSVTTTATTPSSSSGVVTAQQQQQQQQENRDTFNKYQVLLGWTLVHWSWLLTLFPISGIVKVGTFVADRIVVASTVSVCIFIGYAIVYWMTTAVHYLPAKPLQALFIGWLFSMSYMKVHTRTTQWMDSISLLESSLVTCPNFAKAHMETSKIYSGLYIDKLNLSKSRWHLERAKEIDPDLCDIHQQFAHVAIQQGKYLEYEEELTQAVLCPFTMGGAMEMWQRYWKVAIQNAEASNNPQQLHEIQLRQQKYAQIIQDAVEEEKRKEQQKQQRQQRQRQ